MPSETNPRILIVDDDVLTTAWLRALLQKANYEVDIARNATEAFDRSRAHAFDFIILDRVLPDLDGLELCRRLREEPGGTHVWIIIFSVKVGPEEIMDGLRAGADDYIAKRRGADAEILAKIKMMTLRTRGEGAPVVERERLGRLIAFFSAKGGSGTTTLAVNTAYALQQLAPKSTLLLADMAFPLGSVARMIGFDSKTSIAKLSLELRDRVDRKVVASSLIKHPEYGFNVLQSANDLHESQHIEVSQIPVLFKTLRTMFDYILVDFGHSMSRVTLPVLGTSDLIFVIVSPDVNAVALSKASLNYLFSLYFPRDRIAVIQNRTVPRSWMSKEDIEKELDLPVTFTVPYDGEQMTLATNAHKPYLITYKNTAAASTMQAMAQLIVERLSSPATSLANEPRPSL